MVARATVGVTMVCAAVCMLLLLAPGARCLTPVDVPDPSMIGAPPMSVRDLLMQPMNVGYIHKPAVNAANLTKRDMNVVDLPKPTVNAKKLPKPTVNDGNLRKPGVGTMALHSGASGANMAARDITTTLDPLTEFCREACNEGVGGPECDCLPDPVRQHPVAPLLLPSKNAPLLLPSKNAQTYDKSIGPNAHKQKPVQPFKPAKSEIPDRDGRVTRSHDQVPTTTKDSLSDFCVGACREGRGSLACDCLNHIIIRWSAVGRGSFIHPGRYPFGSKLSQDESKLLHDRIKLLLSKSKLSLDGNKLSHYGNKLSSLCEKWCGQGLTLSACECNNKHNLRARVVFSSNRRVKHLLDEP